MAAEDAPLTIKIRADATDVEKGLSAAMRAATREVDNLRKRIDTMGGESGQRIARLNRDISQTAGNAANSVKQLSFQLGDIATQISAGTSPLRAFATQADQIGIALRSAGGGMAALRTIGGALLDPWLLLPVAITAAGTAMAYFFDNAEKGSAEAAADLAKIATEAENIAKTFPGSAFAQEFARGARQAAQDADALTKQIESQENAIRGARDAFKLLAPDIAAAISLLQEAGSTDAAQRLSVAFGDFNEAMKTGVGINQAVVDVLAALDDESIRNAESVKALTASLQQQQSVFADASANIEDTRMALASYRQEHSAVIAAQERGEQAAAKFTDALIAQDKRIRSLIDSMRSWGAMLGALPGLLAQVPFEIGPMTREAVTANPESARIFLKSKAASQKVASRIDQMDDDFARALAKLLTILPSSAQILSGVRTFDEQKRIFESGVRPAARPGTSRHEQRGSQAPAAADISGVSSDILQAAVAQIPELETLKRIGDDMHVQLKRGADDAKEASRAQATAFDDLFAANQKRLEQAQLQNEIMADSTLTEEQRTAQLDAAKASAEQAAIAEQLLNAAKTQGLAITPELTAQINQQAQAMAAAGLSAETMADKQRKAAQQSAALAQEAQQAAQAIAGGIGSAITGFISDLRNGVDSGEAFQNMLNRILDTLIDLAVQLLIVKPLTQGLTSLFGGGIGGAGIPFSFAEQGGVVGQPGPMRRGDPRWWIGAPSFATGGVVGMPHGAVPVLAHRGETILPKGARIGGGDVTNNVGDIHIDMSGTGMVTATTDQGKLLGRQLEAAMQVVLVRESRPGGILRRQGTNV